MVPAKRRHGSSAAAVPSQSQRTGPFVSSAAPSSIAQRSQPSRFCPPSRRANPSEHTPSSRLNSIAPSSNPRVSFQQARVTSEASDSAAGPENDADPFEREDDDFMSEVIMAVNVRGRGNVGCCYYIARDERLLLLSDVSGGGLEVVETCEQNTCYSFLQKRLIVTSEGPHTAHCCPFVPEGRGASRSIL